jgi:hypothetical protein
VLFLVGDIACLFCLKSWSLIKILACSFATSLLYSIFKYVRALGGVLKDICIDASYLQVVEEMLAIAAWQSGHLINTPIRHWSWKKSLWNAIQMQLLYATHSVGDIPSVLVGGHNACATLDDLAYA